MKIDNRIIKSALLGFSNHPFNRDIFPTALQEHLSTEGKERGFLEALTLNFAYNEGGFEPTTIEGISKELPEAKEERLPYCSELYEALIREIVLEKNYSLLEFFPKVVSELNELNQIVPAKYMRSLKIENRETLRAFGETGAWIASMSELKSLVDEVDYLDMNLKNRRDFFETRLKERDLEGALAFLKDIFEAENVKAKLGYVKLLEPYVTTGYEEILTFLDASIGASSSKTKSQEELENYMLRLKMRLPNSKEFEESFEKYFSQIFQSSQSGMKLKTKKVVQEILNEVPTLEGEYVDEQLSFVFSITPLSYWSKLLGVKVEEVVAFILKRERNEVLLKPLMSALEQGDAFELLDAILSDKKVAKKSNEVNFLAPELFALLSDESFKKLFEKHLKKLSCGNLLRPLSTHKALKVPWSFSFTKEMLKAHFETYQYEELAQAVWSVAPYLHNDGVAQLEKMIEEAKKRHFYGVNRLEDSLDVLVKIRQRYQAIND